MDHGRHQAPQEYAPGEGVPATLIRSPVRIVVVVLVLPVRMGWDALTALGHAADRVLLRPLGRSLAWLLGALVLTPLTRLYTWVLTPLGRAASWLARALLVRPWTGLWRYVAVPVARYGIAAPAVWLYRAVLTPLGHGLRWLGTALLAPAARGLGTGLAWALTTLLVLPSAALWRYVIVPVVRYGVTVPVVWLYASVLAPLGRGAGRALGRLVTTLLVTPASWVHRRILTPVGREIAAAFEVAWRVAGYVSRAIGRLLARIARHLIGAPASWVYRTVCTPVGHVVRDAVWAPARRAAAEAGRTAREALAAARETARRARRDAWRALTGSTDGARSREPVGVPARTLGSTTTVPSAAQASETSPTGGRFAERG
ncbi:hypothetical protein [Streptomyces sp. NPDC006267]|uniref:hypothetical protein n=1 Tax=Streptomyces sp. NPDC006267 TaxID=3157173 RepID=UPI0033B0BDEB